MLHQDIKGIQNSHLFYVLECLNNAVHNASISCTGVLQRYAKHSLAECSWTPQGCSPHGATWEPSTLLSSDSSTPMSRGEFQMQFAGVQEAWNEACVRHGSSEQSTSDWFQKSRFNFKILLFNRYLIGFNAQHSTLKVYPTAQHSWLNYKTNEQPSSSKAS